jgi:hypothetical protein
MTQKTFLYASLLTATCAALLQAAQPAVLTRAGNNLRTGCYQDSILTPAAVAQRGLRVYFNLPMEGDARGTESQILIAPDVAMQDGGKRNVALVSSLNNLVWTYDAVTSDILWVQKLGVPISVKASIGQSIDAWGINDHIGVLSTGVIDPATNIWYGIAWMAPDQIPQHGKHFVVGLHLQDGSLAFRPVQMPPAYDAVMRKQRVSLGLASFPGVPEPLVITGSGSQLETSSTSAGFLIAFGTKSHKVTVMPLARMGGGAGIWMSGSGLIIDESKAAIFGVTGNGTFDPAVGDWAETIFHATYTPTGFSMVDWWTAYLDAWRSKNSPWLRTPRLAGHSLSTAKEVDGQPVNAGHAPRGMPADAAMGDEDLGSAQGFYVPKLHEYGVSGKDGVLYMVNTTSMGKTKPADLKTPAGMVANLAKLLSPPIWLAAFAGNGVNAASTNAQELNNNVWFDGRTHHMHMTPVQDTDADEVFAGGENSNVRAWRINPDHTLTFLANSDDVASPDLANTPPGGMTGWMCAASSAGILACTRPHGDANKTVTPGDLFIFDSRNFGTRPDGSKFLRVLWRSDQHGISFPFNKFDPPVIWDGKVFVPSYDGNTGTLAFGLN